MKLYGWLAFGVLMLAPVPGWAQHGGHGGTMGGMDMGSMNMSHADPMQDAHFLSMAGRHFQHGIELAQLGQEKAARDDVRQFAVQLADDEQAAADRLQALQPQAPGAQAGEDMSGMGGMHMGGTGGKSDPMAEMQQHLDRLRLLDGAAFDVTFLQIVKQHHEGALRLAKQEAKGGARGELKAFADDTLARATKAVKAIQQLQKAMPSTKR